MFVRSIVADAFGTNCYVVAPGRGEECLVIGEGAIRYTGTALRVGSLRAEPGDWIVRDSSQLGVAFFPMSPVDFAAHYTPADVFEGLNTPGFAATVVAVLAARMGGAVDVTQAELDAVTGKTLTEQYDESTNIFNVRIS